MAEKLLVLSDMWGVKKGLWITSYFGYLQQYYDYDYINLTSSTGIPLYQDCDSMTVLIKF